VITELFFYALKVLLDVESTELVKNFCYVESNGRHEFQLVGGISAHAYDE
jgi:hypothetical protein